MNGTIILTNTSIRQKKPKKEKKHKCITCNKTRPHTDNLQLFPIPCVAGNNSPSR